MRELSNDNEYIKQLSIEDFIPIVEDPTILPINEENVDFFANLLEFHFNAVTQKEGSVGVLSRLEFYSQKIQVILGE